MMSRTRTRRPLAARLNPVSGAVALAVGSMAALPMNTARAQSTGPNLYEEIMVTATRRATSVQDIPYNISALGENDLRELRITRVNELARWVPGMTLVDQGPRGPSPLIVRGISVDDLTFSEAFTNSNGGTVATYVGEIPVYVDLVAKDMERVEILRGPQGTLYGAGSLAGAVRYIPARPNVDEFTIDLGGNVYAIDESDDGSYDVDATVNVPLGERFAFRGLLSYEDRAGFIDQNYLVQRPGFSNPEPDFSNSADVNANLRGKKEDVNDVETWYGRASLLWDITDDIQAIATYHYQNQDVGGRQANHEDSIDFMGSNQGVEITSGFYENAARLDEPAERTNNIVELLLTWNFGFAELTSATGYDHYENDGQRDQTDLLLTFGYTYADFPTFTAFTSEEDDWDTWTQELRLVSTGEGPFSWIGGFFYSDADQETKSTEFTPCLYNTDPSCPPGGAGVDEIPSIVSQYGRNVEYIQDQQRDISEWAVFGELSYRFTDEWQVTVGGRYFDIEDDNQLAIGLPLLNQILGIDPTDPAEQIALNSTKSDASFDDFIIKLNTSYDINDDLMIYATFSEGYRNGGSNAIQDCADLPASANVVCGTSDQLGYRADETDNYEVGLRSQLLDNAMTFNAALFWINWDKIQVGDVSDSGGFPITVNGNEAVSKGLELEVAWQIDENWSVRGSYSFTDAELDADAPQLAEGTAEKGDRLPGTPRHQGSLWASYNQAISNSLDIQFDYGLTAQTDIFTKLGRGSRCCRPDDGVTDFVNPGPGEELSGFDIHYASVTLSGQRWDARLYANNLWDKEQVTGVRTDRSLLGVADGGFDPAVEYAYRRYFNYVLTPRTVGLDFRYKFGGL